MSNYIQQKCGIFLNGIISLTEKKNGKHKILWEKNHHIKNTPLKFTFSVRRS